jgi:hypothetical protein
MMTLKEKKALLKTLENAYNTCFDCGDKYGVYSVGCSSIYEGTCNVCGETKRITETRDFAYFITGIRKLKLEIQNEKSNSQTKVQQSKEPSC